MEEYAFIKYFKEITQIPHGSGNMECISSYCVNFAKARNLRYIRDEYNNVIIFKDASADKKDSKPIIIQGHLDMVCEKLPDKDFDFKTQGLELIEDGDFLKANGTTLGGDDGIAVAYALALLDDDSISHPPLEVVLTVNEETSMDGVKGLDTSVLSGKRMINIDIFNEGEFTVGCSGGLRQYITLPVTWENIHGTMYSIEISGLLGGHSGCDAMKGRASANVLLSQLLNVINSKTIFNIAALKGGDKDNAIAFNAMAKIVCDDADEGIITELVDSFIKKAKNKYPTEENLNIEVKKLSTRNFDVLTDESGLMVIGLLNELPYGIQKMSPIPDLPQTSLNMGNISLMNDKFRVSFALRSSLASDKKELSDTLSNIAKLFGADSATEGEYPEWEYVENSELNKKMSEIFEKEIGRKPIVNIIHAGVECGFFSQKIKGLDAVAFGPDVFDIHTVNERLSISSSVRIWNYLVKLFAVL